MLVTLAYGAAVAIVLLIIAAVLADAHARAAGLPSFPRKSDLPAAGERGGIQRDLLVAVIAGAVLGLAVAAALTRFLVWSLS